MEPPRELDPSALQGFLSLLKSRVAEKERQRLKEEEEAELAKAQRRQDEGEDGFPGIANRQKELEERKRQREEQAARLVAEEEAKKEAEARTKREEEERQRQEERRRRAAEQELQRQRETTADVYRSRRLKTFAWSKLRLFIRGVRRREIKADRFANENRRERAFRQWLYFLSVNKLTLAEREASDDREADAFFSKLLARKAMVAWLFAGALQRQKFRLVQENQKERIRRDCIRRWRKSAARMLGERLKLEEQGSQAARAHYQGHLSVIAFRGWLAAMPALKEERQSLLLQEKLWLRSQQHLNALAKHSIALSPPRRHGDGDTAVPGGSPLASPLRPRPLSDAAPLPTLDDEIGRLIKATRTKLDKLSSGVGGREEEDEDKREGGNAFAALFLTADHPFGFDAAKSTVATAETTH